MAQVFGNRILGGIGAPGGGMSESFGAGVNTALNQRTSRQGMVGEAQRQRMLEQEFTWKGEDREEARRRRAAAEAAAASAKARQDAMNAALMAGLRIPAAPVSALPPQGPEYPTPVSRAPARPTLTFGGAAAPVTGGGGTTVVGGAAGSDMLRGGGTGDRLGAPTGRPALPPAGPGQPAYMGTNIGVGVPATVAPRAVPARNPNVPIPSTTGPLPSYVDPAGLWTAIRGDTAAAAEADVMLQQGLINEYEYQQLSRGSRAQQVEVISKAYRRRNGEDIPFFVPGTTPPVGGAPVEAATSEAAPAAPAAPAPAPAGPVAITLPDGSTMEFDTGTSPQYPAAPQANLTFGPQLGAVADRPDLSVSMRVMNAAGGQTVPPARVEQYVMTPVRVGAEMQEALSLREELVRRAGIYQEYNDVESFSATLQQIGELDDQLVDLQTAQGLVDLQFNSPQRLEVALSAKTGWDIAVQPNPQGTFDVFVDGQLWQQMDRDQIGSFSQGLLDDAYAAKQAERAQQQFEAQLEIEKTIATEGIKTEYGMVLEALKADRMTQELLLKAQLNPANTELVKSETDGMIHVYDKLAQQYVGYIDPQPIDPTSGEALTQPLFVPYSQ